MARRFTEKEAAALLRQAAEIQSGESGTNASGISLDELRTAATEIGISQPAFDRAVERGLSSGFDKESDIFSLPKPYSCDRVMEGELTDDGWEQIVADLRRTFGEQGVISVRGSTHEWSTTKSGMANITLTARQSGDSVKVSVQSNLDGLPFALHAAGTAPLILSLVFIIKVFALPQSVLIMLGIAWIAVWLLAIRFVLRQQSRRYQNLWPELLMRTARTVEILPSTEEYKSLGNDGDATTINA